ncbi:MAG: 50S ribosomal protein L6 [Candidatus Aminicenantia bacterium]
MSRIGKRPIDLPGNVKVNIGQGELEIEGPKGKLTTPLPLGIKARLEDQKLIFERTNNSKQQKAFHGLARSLAYNAVIGATEGFSKQLEIIGVGYRAQLKEKELILSLGYSHPVVYSIPEEVEIKLEKPTLITITGIDKQKVGQVAAEIRAFRKPDPYKLKGIRYVDEKLRKKERKAGIG